MSGVHVIGVVGEDEDGHLKVMVSCTEATQAWKFILRNGIVVLVFGKSDDEYRILFMQARELAQGVLHEAARVRREVAQADSRVVVPIHGRKHEQSWATKCGLLGATD